MDERFHYRDSNGQRGTIDIYDENTGCFNVLGAMVLIGFLISWIFDGMFGGLSDVYKYCEGIMIFMLIIVGIISSIFMVISGINNWNPAVSLIIIGVLSAIIQFLIMRSTIAANTSLNFFNVFGAILVAIVEAFLAVLAGFIVGGIIFIIIKAVKGDEDGKNEDDEVV